MLQARTGAWTTKQFPTRTTESIMNHLCSEAGEVTKEPFDIEEYADCFLLLLDAAFYNGISIAQIVDAAETKLEKNKQRNWGEPNSEGFTEHLD